MPQDLRSFTAKCQFAWFAVLLLVWTTLLLAFPLDPDYTAGELLDHLTLWLESGVLYPALGEGSPPRVLNYPPLVLILGRALTALGAPPLLAGRLVNWLGSALIVAALAAWLRARGVKGSALLGTIGLLGASVPVIYGAGQFHIEMWAAGLTIGGFALADRGRTDRALFAAGVVLALACFAKQTQVVPALVALAWLWRQRRSGRGLALAGFVLVGAAGAAAMSIAWGGEVWRHLIVYTAGTYSLANLGLQLASHAAPWTILLGIAAWAGTRGRRGSGSDLAWWYWCGSLLWSMSAIRDGSGYPYFLDLHLATVMIAGPVIFGDGRTKLRRVVVPWLAAAQVVGANIGVGALVAVNLGRLAERSGELASVCAALPPEGPVLVEEAGLARACGRRPELHPFIMTSLARRGLWDASTFEEDVRAGSYSVVVVPFDPRDPVPQAQRDRWTQPVLAAFAQARTVETYPSGWRVLRW